MIDKFEEGKYYRWIGPVPEYSGCGLRDWNGPGGMDYVIDGKNLKCIKVLKENKWCALFEGMLPFKEREGTWHWGSNLQYFEKIEVIDDKAQFLLEF